jgi:hypothetical protein
MNEPKLGDVLSGVDPVAFLNIMAPESVRYVGTALFALAILHTFSVSYFQRLAAKYENGSIGENFFHLLGEIEVVFGLWSGVLLTYLYFQLGGHVSLSYLEHLEFTESMFVFVIMVIAATKPILSVASRGIFLISKLLPLPGKMPFVFASLVVGPLMGSYITEPAAMTVTALLLRDVLFESQVSSRTKYVVLGVLFVNVSIGGVLTPYAAPPVLMVARTWNWDVSFMMEHFGWKAILACICNGVWVLWACRRDLRAGAAPKSSASRRSPIWLEALHLVFLAGVVMFAHHPTVFIWTFLFFLGVVAVTEEYQEELQFRSSLLVAFFLAGLVVLGSVQRWWLEPLLMQLSDTVLFFGATALTSITDNAALTYLGAQVPNLSLDRRYFLVAGAVAGGGLTVIANAPNPAGYSLLQKSFGKNGIGAGPLFLAALPPTLVAVLFFGFLR